LQTQKQLNRKKGKKKTTKEERKNFGTVQSSGVISLLPSITGFAGVQSMLSPNI